MLNKQDCGRCSGRTVRWICVGLGALLFLSAMAIWAPDRHRESELETVVHRSMWTTYSVGNPTTYVLANVRSSAHSENVICGRINYEKSDNRGWAGYTDFYLERGVIYIAPPHGRYAKNFNFYCLASTPAPGTDTEKTDE